MVAIFSDHASLLRLVSAILKETQDDWLTQRWLSGRCRIPEAQVIETLSGHPVDQATGFAAGRRYGRF